MEKRLIFAAIVLSTAALAGPSAFGQDATRTASQQNAQATKKPKVWTDDNIDSVRTPSDVYQAQEQKEKEAQQQAAAAKQAAAASQSQAAPESLGQLPHPKTVHEADTIIAQKKQLLASQQDYLKQVQQQLNDPSVTGLDRTRLEWRLKSHTITAQNTQSQVTQLEAQREALAKKADNSSSGNSSGSNPQ